MLSCSNISGSQGQSYFMKDDYYLRNEKAKWQGKLKDELGLPEEINKSDFNALIHENEKRAGIDLTFSAPKSCSISMHLNENHYENIAQAHDVAVKSTLDFIENNYINYRKTENYVTQTLKADNMVAARINHLVSRNQDPQLHTHAIIINKTRCHDGKLRAISNELIYKNKIFLGIMYRSELCKNLQESGYEVSVTNKEQGFFELKGISKNQIDAFSSRRQEIVEFINEKGWDMDCAKAKEAATLLTREAKQECDMDKLVKSWKKDFKGLKINNHSLHNSTANQMPAIDKKELLDNVTLKISEQTFAFRKEEFSRLGLKEGLGKGITQPDIELYFKENLNKDIYTTFFEGEKFYTTTQSIELEKRIVDRVLNGKDQIKVTDCSGLQDFLNESGLSLEQKNAVKHIITSTDRFCAVQGYAGTGKTFMLSRARHFLEIQGYRVQGLAFTGKAAQSLQSEAGIESRTIHSQLLQLEKEAGNDANISSISDKKEWNFNGLSGDGKGVWLVDEASLIDNRLMDSLHDAAVRKNAKVVMIGDIKQLQPIGAGNSFSNMIKEQLIDYVEMKKIIRQVDTNLLNSVKDAAIGRIKEALVRLEKNIIEIKDRDMRFSAIAEHYAYRLRKERDNSTILTGSNSDRKELNQRVREYLKSKGELKPGIELEIRTINNRPESREFSKNDRIMFLKNDRSLAVKNGQTGSIKEINNDKIIVLSDGEIIKLDMRDYNYIDHANAMTSHKAQGITRDKVFINIDTHQKSINSQNKFYMDISRARNNVFIYTDDKRALLKAVSTQQFKLSSKDFDIDAYLDSRGSFNSMDKDNMNPQGGPGKDKELSVQYIEDPREWLLYTEDLSKNMDQLTELGLDISELTTESENMDTQEVDIGPEMD